MNTEQMHKTLLQAETNQKEFVTQFELLLRSKVYREGITINGKTYQFDSLRKYIADPEGLNQTIPVIAALLLPKPEVRARFMAILAEETNKEAEESGITLRQLNRKYKSSKDETSAQKDFLNHPDIHNAALAGIPLTNAQKNKIRKQDLPPCDPMTTIRYKKGDIESALQALARRHSLSDLTKLQKLVDQLLAME